jgi:hypothetical protein
MTTADTQSAAQQRKPSPAPVPTPVPHSIAAPTVAILNASTVLTDAQLAPVVAACAKQVLNDFGPVWGIAANVTFVPKGSQPPAGAWQLVVLDDSDQAGALGYHDLTKDGLPMGKVFARTDLNNHLSWSVTISHELLEMLGDPDISLTVFDQTTNTAGVLYAYESCDACEDDRYGYEIDGVLVSDFVTRSWFTPGLPAPYDFKGHITKALDILPGGYIGVFNVTGGSGWQQKTNAEDRLAILRARRQPRGSRRERRSVPREQWLHSER